MAFLVESNGPYAGSRHPLGDADCRVGRHPECDITIESVSVSRFHAKISLDGGHYWIEDLRSRSHTYVNDTPIERERLKHGDRIAVGEISFVFHEDDRRIPIPDDDAEFCGPGKSRGSVKRTASPEAKLDALVEITQSLGKALALDEVLPKVLNSLFKIFVQTDRGLIGLKDDNDVLVPRWTKLRREGTEDTIRVSRTIVNHVMESQEAILSADAANNDRFEMSQSIADFRIRSMMCAPLIDSEKRSIGVLQIDTLDQRQRFQQEDLEVLVAVATLAGIAINNAKRHDHGPRFPS